MWSQNQSVDKILTALVVLFAVGFMLQQSIFITAAFILLVVSDGFVLYARNDATFYLLVIFATLYILFNGRSGIIVLGMPMAYYLGRRVNVKEAETNFRKLYLLLAFSMAMHVVLNFLYEYSRFGSSIYTTGVHYDIWSGHISTATGIMINATLLASILYYLCFLEKRMIIRCIGIAMIIFLGIYNIMMGERSYFFLLVIAFVAGIVLNMLTSGLTTDIFKTISKIVFFIAIAYIIVLLIFRFYGDEINSFFDSSYFYHRFFSENSSSGMFESSRWERKARYFSMMFDYPLGGGNMREIIGGSSHELWLDVLDYGGIPSYILIVLYSLVSIRRAFMAFKNKRLETETRLMILVGMVAINAQFFVEPIIAGAPVLLMSYCMLDGSIQTLLERENQVLVKDEVNIC